jgi:hypothetical protein
MNPSEYLSTYQDQLGYAQRNHLKWSMEDRQHGKRLAIGMLQVGVDPTFGKTLPGGFMAFCLTDHRETLSVVTRRGQQKLVQVGDEYLAKHPKEPQLMPTTAKPFELKLFGNDEAVYAKYYATLEEALSEQGLFEAVQPLKFDEIVQEFNFTFVG